MENLLLSSKDRYLRSGKNSNLYILAAGRYTRIIAVVTLIFFLSGFLSPAYAGPALYFRILSPPNLPKMSYSQCVAKSYRTINLRVGGKTKSEKSYAMGSNTDITAVVACYKVGNTTTATVMVTSPSRDMAKKILPQLVGDMRTPNF